jgi:predicted nucleotidyltransferase component of viral defense system
VVQIDYSLNEPAGILELFEIENGLTIQIYSFHDLVGEKFRAVLQQEVRDRFRRQDTYDLFFLLRNHPASENAYTKQQVLKSLTIRAAARDLQVGKESMRNPEIRRRSQRDYLTLRDEIDDTLPPFDEVYDFVRAFYEDLPWAICAPKTAS